MTKTILTAIDASKVPPREKTTTYPEPFAARMAGGRSVNWASSSASRISA